MKKLLMVLVAGFISLAAISQTNDIMQKHAGEKLEVKVIKVGETTITFKYPGEDAEQTIGKYAIASITYGGSGRKEAISEKIVVMGKGDWESVQILTDKSQVLGLKEGESVRGKTSGLLSYNTAGSADKKATREIKEAAAEMGAPFVLMTSDKSDGFGVKQSIKNGVTYSYK
ncbi:MAG TPA: hypothetical protein PK951_11365 [Chitinophagaceae bacterium]|nr:hypothetical protein [Chitinophagaceae bacterium]